MIVSELLTLNLDIITKKFTDLLKRFSGGFISGRKYETSTNEWPKSTILTSFSGTSWSLTGKSISAPLLDLKTSRKLAINKSWEIRVFATFELLTTCFHKNTNSWLSKIFWMIITSFSSLVFYSPRRSD